MNEQFTGLVPPHNVEAEQAVIGAVFLEPKSIELAMRYVSADDFYRQQHQRIFLCMTKLHEIGSAVDLVTVSASLSAKQTLEEAGGISYLTEVASSVPTAANIEYYAEIVSQKSTLRKLISTATEIVQDGYIRQGEIDELLDETEKKILEISNRKNTKAFQEIKDVVFQAYSKIDMISQLKGEVTGIPTGYKELDRLTAGFQRNDLIIVAARPSVGKTAFVLNIAQNVAKQAKGFRVAIFSLEMGSEQLVMRMLSAEGNVDAQKLRTGKLENTDWKNLQMAASSLEKTNIFIDDTPGIRVSEIRSKCRRLKQEHGLDLVMIDYLQLIQGSEKSRENRQQEVSEISRSLKGLARELEVPVIALSQLSRGVETRQDKRPMMSDIRESGSIEQDADIVAFLYRDDYYDKETENQNIIEIIIAKQRNGPVGTVKLSFQKEYNKFVNLDFHAYGDSN
ncbi:MAG: dnaB [Bacillales bacterium]|jgi:replicative DNA helicase|nr:dnaB [Bacillales bacterium]